MLNNDEIGGYFELECGFHKNYHNSPLLFNSSRNALSFYLMQKKIKKLYVPMFTCETVWKSVERANCTIIPYDVDTDFTPLIEFQENQFYLINNYFGISSKKNTMLCKNKKGNVIFDNSQAFYAKQCGIANIYSPRKFFGLPDGGILFADLNLEEEYEKLPRSHSYEICSHLLIRHDKEAQEGYDEFVKNGQIIAGFGIEKMSFLTQNLMKSIHYEKIAQIRKRNFNYLHNRLKNKNLLKFELDKDDIPMVYPFKFGEKKELQAFLLKHKIYAASYWPKSNEYPMHMASENCRENRETIIPLTIDQRYTKKDMDRIVFVLEKFFGNNG